MWSWLGLLSIFNVDADKCTYEVFLRRRTAALR